MSAYPKEIKKRAMVMYLADKMTVKEISDELGIAHQNVSNWVRELRNAKPRADKGKPRQLGVKELQLDLFDAAPQKNDGPRKYEKKAQEYKPESRATPDIEPYSLGGARPLQTGVRLPAPNPKGMRHRMKYNPVHLSDAVIDGLVDRFKRSQGMGRFSPDYRAKVFPVLMGNLLIAHRERCQITYIRDTSKSLRNLRMFRRVIDWLGDEGLIVNEVQEQQPGGGIRSWMAPKAVLVGLFESDGPKWRLVPSPDHRPIVYRVMVSGKKEKWADAEIPGKHEAAAARLGKFVRTYNAALKDVVVAYGSMPIDPYLHRVFNGSMSLGGRFYGSAHQTMRKQHRQHITIDGEPTVELDYSALHPSLLLWRTGGALSADPYTEIAGKAGITRELVKALLLRLINSENVSDFCRVVSSSGNSSIKAEAEEGRAEDWFIPGVPTGYKGADFVKDVEATFPTLAGKFGGEIGLELQHLDSNLMADVLAECLSAGIVALPVHDSVIVPQSRADDAREIMFNCYQRMTKRPISIK
jgi:transposase-like protein